jgi:tetratricopeptide (TPR) repeat protein
MRSAPVALSLGFVSSIALAQQADPAAEAKRQYNLGTQAYSAHRFVEAALAFEAAAAIKPNAVTLYTAGLAWEQANQPERAADAFSRSLDLPGLLAQQQQNAKERVATLERSLGTLVVTGPASTKVQLDALTEVVVPARLHAPPGTHVLTIRWEDAPLEKRDVQLEVGKATTLELSRPVAPPPKIEEPAPPAPVVAPPAPPEPERMPVTRILGIGALGAGVAFGVGTIALGISALDAKSAYDAAPTRAAFDHANGLATWANVAWITAAVFVAAGVTLVLLPGPSRPKAAWTLHPGGIVFVGAF